MIYLLVFILLLFLSYHYDIQGKKKGRDEWYIAILVILILIAGLRWRFAADSVRYMYNFFYKTPKLWEISGNDLIQSGTAPLWIILNSLVKTLGGKFFVVQLIQATIVNTLFFKYFKKHSAYPYICIVFFFMWKYAYFNMMIMKAATAVSILLFANDYFLERKHVKGILLVLLATGFHQFSILLLITPFLLFLRFNKLGIVVLCCAFPVGAILQSMLGDFFEMLDFSEGISEKLDSYLEGDHFLTSSMQIGYYVVNVFPYIIYPIWYILHMNNCHKTSPISELEPFIIIGLIMYVMEYNIHVFYRYTYIYSAYFIIYIVQFFMEFSTNSSRYRRYKSYSTAIILLSPLLVMLLLFNRFSPFDSKYNPYSSIIEKKVDYEREQHYREEGLSSYDKNEY